MICIFDKIKECPVGKFYGTVPIAEVQAVFCIACTNNQRNLQDTFKKQ